MKVWYVRKLHIPLSAAQHCAILRKPKSSQKDCIDYNQQNRQPVKPAASEIDIQ